MSDMSGSSDTEQQLIADTERLIQHWEDCPLPPDANCEQCIEYARRFIWEQDCRRWP